MKTYTYEEIEQRFISINKNNLPHEHAVIVFDGISFPSYKSLIERSYKISSDSPMFNPHYHGCALFGDRLDGKDLVRLDDFMRYYHGQQDKYGCPSWVVEYCYLLPNEIITCLKT